MALLTLVLWVVVGWIAVASAAYYGSLQALRTFYEETEKDEER